MTHFTEFGLDWIARSDTDYSPYDDANVTRYSQASPLDHNGNAIFPTKRRVGLVAPEGSAACIMSKDNMPYGIHTAYLIGRFDSFDPNIVVGWWTHYDYGIADCTEADYEFGAWNDPNNPLRVQLGVIKANQRYGAHHKVAAPSYYYHKISIQQTATVVSVVARGWRDSDGRWVDYAYYRWEVATTHMGRVKLGIGPMNMTPKYQLPKAASLPARVVLAGYEYSPS